jgi:MYXO-CTERM domain-containing protein
VGLHVIHTESAMAFDMTGLPPSVYTLTGYIQDHADHVVTDVITFTVEGEASVDESGSGGSGTGEPIGTSTGAGASEGSSEGSGGVGLEGELDDGCGCRSGQGPVRTAGAWLLGIVGLLGISRRRR